MQQIKAIAMDVDGVLTDGGVWWGPSGEEWKRFHFADIMGLSLARKSGLIMALISGENSPLVDRLAHKLSIGDVYKDCKDKAGALRDFSERHSLPLREICFIGDDVNDLEALEIAGVSACPGDARPSVREACQVVTKLGGGNGAVREIVDMLLTTRTSMEESVARESMRLADYVMNVIARQGVKHVFVVTGGGAMHLNDALARCRDLTFVCNHHEQASAIAAENYSKATNNLGVALVTTGPGGTNAITGVTGAWLDSTPSFFISGQVKRADRMYGPDGTPLGVRQRGSQEVDIVSLVKPITKYAVTIDDPQSILYHLEKAIYLARTGRPGPVWIDIPIDVQAAPIDPDSMRQFDPAELRQSSADDWAHSLREVIERLNRAERPFIFAGNGVRVSGAAATFEKLVHRLNIPVGLTWLAMDLLDDDDELFVGRPGTVASRGANFALQNADFVLVIGARLDPPLMGWDPRQFARGAYKAVVDIDPAELRKLEGFIDTPICADGRCFIEAMLEQGASVVQRDRSCWIKRCHDWKIRYPIVQPQHRAPGLVSVYHLAEVIGEEVGLDDRIVSGSSGSAIEIFLLAYRARKGRRVFHTAGLGAMGFAIPASIGVCLGSGGKKTICVDGDGGFQLNIQELATIAHLKLPIKFFVLKNDGYASIRATQKNYFGGANIGCDSKTGLSVPDYRKIARAYGVKTTLIEDQSDLRSAVRGVLKSRGPVVCDVRVVPDESRAPRVTSMQRADGSFVSKPLEDLWPFLDRSEFAENMIVEPVRE